MTRMRLTHTKSVLTSPSCEPRLADTEVVIGQLDTVQAVGGTAGVREALIDVALTPVSCESRRAVAAIAADSVHTGAIVQTLRRGTSQSQGWSAVILIDLTEHT